MAFTRITIDPAVCTGKPCIRGLRFPVARLLGLLAAGESREEILAAYPYLESEDIDEALRYAAALAEDEIVELVR
jgi:uncharacterized protein (DUF433 family)